MLQGILGTSERAVMKLKWLIGIVSGVLLLVLLAPFAINYWLGKQIEPVSRRARRSYLDRPELAAAGLAMVVSHFPGIWPTGRCSL